MAQSGPPYNGERPKSNAHTQNRRTTKTTTNPQPACHAAERNETEWRAPPFMDALSEFYQPCQRSDCFGGNVPDPTTIERVIISRHFPTVFHRVRDQEQQRKDHIRTGQDTTDDWLFSDPVFEADEPVDTLTDLDVGDGVVWNPPQVPLTVVGTTAITLRGPAGGEYTLVESGAEMDAMYTVYPGYGCVPELRHVAPTSSQSGSSEPEWQ